MQIKKINNNKLKVVLNLNDLDDKNIDIDSFLSNSIESQDLFFEILDIAEEKYNFNIENNKAMVEAISLDNNMFILTITKLQSDSLNTYNISFKSYIFQNTENLLSFLSICKKNKIIIKNSQIYKYNNNYYFILKDSNILLENLLIEYSEIIEFPTILNEFLSEYGNKINI